MKIIVTNPKVWQKVCEKNIPMNHRVKIYEKLGGGYRLGMDEQEPIFNKLTEVLAYIQENNIKESQTAKLNEGIMNTIHQVIRSSSSAEDFIKKFISKHSNKLKNNQDTKDWLLAIYKDVKNIKEGDNSPKVYASLIKNLARSNG